MNLAEGLVSMPVVKESNGRVWKYFNFELDESERPVDRVVCLPAPDGPKWAQTGQDSPRRVKTAPDGFTQSQTAPEEPQIQEADVV